MIYIYIYVFCEWWIWTWYILSQSHERLLDTNTQGLWDHENHHMLIWYMALYRLFITRCFLCSHHHIIIGSCSHLDFFFINIIQENCHQYPYALSGGGYSPDHGGTTFLRRSLVRASSLLCLYVQEFISWLIVYELNEILKKWPMLHFDVYHWNIHILIRFKFCFYTFSIIYDTSCL